MILVVAEDSEDRRRLLQTVLATQEGDLIYFDLDRFDSFIQEIETQPLFSSLKVVVLRRAELLNAAQIDDLCRAVENLSAKVTICCTFSTLASQSRLRKYGSLVVEEKGESKRQKESRLVDWVMGEVSSQGIVISKATALYFVQKVNSLMLAQELNKLLCFIGTKENVEVNDILAITTINYQETLWQLGEAIFEKSFSSAYQIFSHLVSLGLDPLMMIAHIRSQFCSMMAILEQFQIEGIHAVEKLVPQLKGKLLRKKISLAKNYGMDRLKKGFICLFETEIKVRNCPSYSSFMWMMLLVKLSAGSLFFRESLFPRTVC